MAGLVGDRISGKLYLEIKIYFYLLVLGKNPLRRGTSGFSNSNLTLINFIFQDV